MGLALVSWAEEMSGEAIAPFIALGLLMMMASSLSSSCPPERVGDGQLTSIPHHHI